MSYHSLKELDEVAQFVCLPNAHKPMRLPTYPSIDKTALFRYRWQNTQSLGGTSEGTIPNVKGRRRFVLTRDPAAPYLVDTELRMQHTIGGNFTYFQGAMLLRTEEVFRSSNNDVPGMSQAVTFERTYPMNAWASLPCGKYQGKQWFIVPRTLNPQGTSSAIFNRVGICLYSNDGQPIGTTGATSLQCPYSVEIETMRANGELESLPVDADWNVANGTAFQYLYEDVTLLRISNVTFNSKLPGAAGTGVYMMVSLAYFDGNPGAQHPVPSHGQTCTAERHLRTWHSHWCQLIPTVLCGTILL